jgi:hypothetical protein
MGAVAVGTVGAETNCCAGADVDTGVVATLGTDAVTAAMVLPIPFADIALARFSIALARAVASTVILNSVILKSSCLFKTLCAFLFD